ncbi:SpvB/TcaC N-terminal domain-containing protein [Owenweeksia hongkongensis]|uniref:SpvB/TcaC N-terminal domain-containing protein n=1 Tax=Owenweeksia hongkongensis TaxID=253245 RepID=UPI003A92A0D4
MKIDLASKVACWLLAFILIGNDICASAFALHNFRPFSRHTDYQYEDTRLLLKNKLRSEVEKHVPEGNGDNNVVEEAENIIFNTEELSGYFGGHPKNPMDLPIDHIFSFKVSGELPDLSNAYLLYDVIGFDDGLKISSSVNEKVSKVVEFQNSSDRNETVRVRVEPANIERGLNYVRFAVINNKTPVTIENVRVTFSDNIQKSMEGSSIMRDIPSDEDFHIIVENGMKDEAVVQAVKFGDMPAIPKNITNITRGSWGYKVKFLEEQIRISIGLNRGLLSGGSISDVKVFYFHNEERSWKVAHNLNVDFGSNNIEAMVPANSSYFTGMIETPEMPEVGTFMPTALSDLEAANPSAGMSLMQPPSVSQTGEASVNYPLQIPEGRQGMTPKINLTYSSDGGTGWLGMGWSLSTPSISIDSRWGVPTFPETIQEEVYLMNGKSLSMEGEWKGNRSKEVSGTIQTAPRITNKDGVRFFERQLTSYKEVKRFGDAPTNYFWTEVTASQTTYYYGTSDGSDIDNNYVLKDDNGNVLRWYLSKVIDKWGNTINYSYSKSTVTPGVTSIKNGGVSMVPGSIQYTGHGSDLGKYEIVFVTSSNRSDATISMKLGIKELDQLKLDKVRVLYDGAEVKRFEFNYGTGDFAKTLLNSLDEYRSNSLFYSHEFSYYSSALSYGNKQTIEVDHFNNDLFEGMHDKIASIAGALKMQYYPSPLNTSSTSGWGVGGSLGFGLGLGPAALPNKSFSLSGRFAYSENSTKTSISLNDWNGDGLPDLTYDRGDGLRYYSLKKDPAGIYSFDGHRSITLNGRLNQSQTQNTTYGFDFAMLSNVYYFGMNWVDSKTRITNYTTDYNSDGLIDVVIRDDEKNVVSFGKLDDYGNFEFSSTSANTYNPVVKGASLPAGGNENDGKDFEVVRLWEAPFTGTINISGDAEVPSNLTGEVMVAVQKNNSFIYNFNTLSPGGLTPVNISGVPVTKGDKLMFRVFAGADGQQDLVSWNPEINYATPTNKVDANGLNYSSSSYEDAFLISSPEGVTFSGGQRLKVSWPNFSAGGYSDDVMFTVKITLTDTTNGASISVPVTYMLPAGVSTTIQPSMFTYNGANPNFFNTFQEVPEFSAGLIGTMTFEIFSNSNIDWQDIIWRPEVEFGDQPCGSFKKSILPTVHHKTYNKALKVNAPYSGFNFDPGSIYKVWPGLSTNSGQKYIIFTSDELNEPNDISYKAYVVVKSNGQLLSKMAVVFHNDGTVDYHPMFYTVPHPHQMSMLNHTNLYEFNGDEVYDNEVFIEVYSDNEGVAQVLQNDLSGMFIYRWNGSNEVLMSSTTEYSLFNHEPHEWQDQLLHWGQFVWSGEEEMEPIAVVDLKSVTKEVAEDPQYDFSEDDPSEGSFAGLDPDEMNPMNQKFFPLAAKRGEGSSYLRDYIEDFDSGNNPESLDRWCAFGTHIGTYRHGGTAPGKFGEAEEEPSVASVNMGMYSAYGILPKSSSKTLGMSDGIATGIGPVQYAQSWLSENSSKYFASSEEIFMDVNGDGYPDAVELKNGSIKVRKTNPLGAHSSQSSFSYYAQLKKSITTSNTISLSAGSFLNDDLRFTSNKTSKSASGSVSVTGGEDKGVVDWLDFNGDGMMDRLHYSGDILKVGLSMGTSIVQNATIGNYEIFHNANTAKSFGASGSITKGKADKLDNKESKGGFSFGAGIGLSSTGAETMSVFQDINGDGLPDKINRTPQGQISIKINRGTDFISYTPGSLSNMNDIGTNEALGVSANIAATYGITLFTNSFLHLKMSISVNGQYNYALNEGESMLRDMNGDGIADYVEVTDDGNIEVAFAKIDKSNLLSEVVNPLGGGFSIDYKREGNKFGLYKTQIGVMNYPEDDEKESKDKMVWDMPNSKWVMSEMTVKDGLDLNNGDDLDGEDEITYTYNYDGGIKSRRERDFLGFSRIETVSPADKEEVDEQSNGDYLEYQSLVIEYPRPHSNEPSYRKRFEYLKGIPEEKYQLYHKVTQVYIDDDDPGTNYKTYERKRIAHQHNSYEYRKVDMKTGSAKINTVMGDPGAWDKVLWGQLGEASCIFPALISMETINYPQVTTADKDKFHAVKYEVKYDRYTNIVEYSNEGLLESGTVQSVIVDTIFDYHYEYLRESHKLSDLINKVNEFSNPEYVPERGVFRYKIECSDPDYEPDYIYDDGYMANDPCELWEGDPIGDDHLIYTTHRKAVDDIIYVYADTYPFTYSGKIIAQMGYYTPNATVSNQTNMLKWHKTYMGVVGPSGLERHTEVGSIFNNKAPKEIWSHLTPTEKAITELTYDGKGNVTQVKGPANHDGQRFVVNYSYDNTVNQFVVSTSNSYGDASCSMYDFATGNLLKMEGPNGHPMQYVYDDFYRLKEVWAPRELYDPAASATIVYAYHPDGHNQNFTKWDKIPVAYTSHNVNTTQGASGMGGTPAVDCSQLIDISGRPNIAFPLETATFMDGMQRVIQVKKDIGATNGSGTYVKKRQVSGISSYDRIGRVSSVSLDVNEGTTVSFLGTFNSNKSTNNQIEYTYDYANRVVSQKVLRENNNVTADYSNVYTWEELDGEEVYCVEQEGEPSSVSYYDAWGRAFAKRTGPIAVGGPVTYFDYDALSQLKSVTDPLGVVTSYNYDDFGRLVSEVHDDRGTTTNTFDLAGNLIEVVTPGTGAGSITMEYDFNRPKLKTSPLTPEVNNVKYTYGSVGDGKNGAGRVTRIIQGNKYHIQEFQYDELGNLSHELERIWVPQVGHRVFNTGFEYDSWGRIKEVSYPSPDLDVATYTYQKSGELVSISLTKDNNGTPITNSLIDAIFYDGYGNMEKIEYGNGTETSFTYSDRTRRMEEMVLLTDNSTQTLLDKDYSYSGTGRVNAVSNSSNSLMGDYDFNYSYDLQNRLKTVVGSFNNMQHEYDLTMEYNDAGGITKKDQSHQITPTPLGQTTDYDFDYTYKGDKKHQIDYIMQGELIDTKRSFEYNSSGSVTGVYKNDPNKVYEEEFMWDEEQRQMAARNANGVHHYLYDQNGERIMKTSLGSVDVYQQGQAQSGSMTLNPYTVYVNPHFVATHYADNSVGHANVEATKHYYMGSQRVASEVISYPFANQTFPAGQIHCAVDDGGAATEGETDGGESGGSGCSEEMGAVTNLKAVLDEWEEEYSEDIFDAVAYDSHYDQSIYSSLTSYYCDPGFEPECLCSFSTYWATEADEEDCNAERIMYWYHSDYLGNTEYVTDMNGDWYEYYWYSPWGEALVENKAITGTFMSPYRFNAKELDHETGNYYYGARYYNPQTSIWLSVDPESARDPHMTPYHFVYNNPVMFVDPNGLHGYIVDCDGNISSEPVDNTGGEEFDVIYNNEMTKTSLPIEPGVINNDNRESVSGSDEQGNYTADILDVSNMENPQDLFEFLAEETDVEWSQTTMDHSKKEDRTWISTTHRGDNEMGAGIIMDREYLNYNLKEHRHSHPGQSIFIPSPGDINSAARLERRFMAPTLKIYLPQTGGYKKYDSYSPSIFLDDVDIIIPK